MAKHDREIMEILEAFDLTKCAHSAAQLTGCDPKTVAHYVAVRDAGASPFARAARPKLIDPYREKIEELVEHSSAKVRADVVHRDHLVPMGFTGGERTTRRAVADAKPAYLAGRRRTYRPWIPEPGMWAQFDWGDGVRIARRPTYLFCAWCSWSRFRVAIPTWDKTLATALSCLRHPAPGPQGRSHVPAHRQRTHGDHGPRLRAGGAPPPHGGGRAPLRPDRRDLRAVRPRIEGGSESTVKIAKADLVPTSANLLADYPSFAALAVAC